MLDVAALLGVGNQAEQQLRADILSGEQLKLENEALRGEVQALQSTLRRNESKERHLMDNLVGTVSKLISSTTTSSRHAPLLGGVVDESLTLHMGVMVEGEHVVGDMDTDDDGW